MFQKCTFADVLGRQHEHNALLGRFVIFIYLLGYWQSVTSFRHYQDLIPNGQNVPHSCLDNFLWHGIGHQRFKGAGPLNRFGIDFIKFKKALKMK
ncbi:hypothetical protein KUTeg_021958 [Tegillarca granosa]|uniref:Temptin Cys/Cys disulfide domain-containing protein n=1 Tax=Tegillarca granosa TaxID=220873 RepID=A0ABQ9E4U4_TEGGR|nr:hypothetical protein KUTeg_021958 [Tegillarca granosa]